MLLNGTAKVYERFGPLLFPCGVPEYSGYLALDKLDSEYASVFINEEQQAITVFSFHLRTKVSYTVGTDRKIVHVP